MWESCKDSVKEAQEYALSRASWLAHGKQVAKWGTCVKYVEELKSHAS